MNARICCTLLAWACLALNGCQRTTPVTEVAAPPGAIDSAAPGYEPPADDWPWWRGPTRNGVAVSAAAPVQFGETTNVIWKAEIPGRGHGSPTVSAGHVFLATADEATQQQSVLALDRQTGQQLWSTVLNQGGFPSSGQMHHKSTHANATVAVNGEAVFVAFLHHQAITAYALDYHGNLLWQQELGAFDSKFGYAPSPLIYKSAVIFAADNRGGGYLAALDQRSGDIIWRKARPAVATYSSPVVAHVAGRDQLLISGAERIVSYDPASGEEIWSCSGAAEATCSTVVWSDSLVFATGGYPQSETVGIDAQTGKRVWSNNTKCYEQSMLLADGYLYSWTDAGVAYCWEAATGKQQWSQRLTKPVSISPVLCNGNIYAADEQGMFVVFRANPEKYEEVAENRLGDQSFASPVICGGRLYIRVAYDSKPGVLYCFGEPSAE